jgi:hypothetical protein
VALLLLTACGDDDDQANAKPDAGSAGSGAGSGGGGGSMIDSGIKPLGDGISGKECTSNADCDGARCATQVVGGAFQQVTAPGGYCTGACMTNADCGEGGACGTIAGLFTGDCFASCTSDSDCRDGYLCVLGGTIAGVTIPSTCRPKPATDQLDDDVVGKACTAATDCPGGSCLMMRGGFMGQGGTALPGGYCSGACLEDAECGAGGVCAPGLLQGMAGDGYRCRDVAMNVKGCDPFPDPLPDNQVGKACTADADCGGVSGTCKTSVPVGGFAFGQTIAAPDGYCSQTCTMDSDCGAGGVCIGAGLVPGSCFKPCESPTDCRTGYGCATRGGGFAMMPAAGGDAGMNMPVMVCAPEMATNDADAGG